MNTALDWFLGCNHVNQIVYNPCTGSCYDGLKENHVNVNQGVESSVSYLLARLTIEKYFSNDNDNLSCPILKHSSKTMMPLSLL